MVVAVPARAASLLLYHGARLPQHLQLPNYWGGYVPCVDYGIGADLRHYLRRDRPLDRLCDGHGVSRSSPRHERLGEQCATVRCGTGRCSCWPVRWPHSRLDKRRDHCPAACTFFHCHAGYVRYSSWCGLYSLRWTTRQHTDEWRRPDRQWVSALPPARWTCELLPPALKPAGSTSQPDYSTASLPLDFSGYRGPYLCLAALADTLWKTYVRCGWERRSFAARRNTRGSSYDTDLCAFGVHGSSGGCGLHVSLQ